MRNQKKRKMWFLFPAAALLSLLCITVGLLVYRHNLQVDLKNASCAILDNVLEQQRFTFTSKLQDQKKSIKIYADFFEYASDITEKEMLNKLNVIAENASFDNVSFIRANGDTIENTGSFLNVSDREYFKQAMAGETVISRPIASKLGGSEIIVFATPIYHEAQVSAVLAGIYRADALSDLLMTAFDGKGETYVCTESGQVIFKANTSENLALYSNLFDLMESTDVYEFNNAKEIREQMAEGGSGYSRYVYNGEYRLLRYAPIGINDWYVFAIAEEGAINPQAQHIMNSTSWFMIAITLLFAATLIWICIVQRKHLQELRKIAFVDELTGAPNKRQFMQNAESLLEEGSHQYAFVILDIDKFKLLNDTLGYLCGDALLKNITEILRKKVYEYEAFGRCESDEYYLMLVYHNDTMLRGRVEEIFAQIKSQFMLQINNSYSLVLCAGVYVMTNLGESLNISSDRARHAHCTVKGKDESGIAFYNEEIRNQILEEKEIENKMHDALLHQEFLLYLQPKYYLKTETMYGVEALVRWNDTTRMIYPNDFIPLFEKNGFITKLDMYMLKKACQTIRHWLDEGITAIPISINFSRLHLKNNHFVDDIAAIVREYHIPPSLIEVELTESTMLHNEEVLIHMLGQLHEYGFTLSMDDFGSGYSSLGLLKNLPVDVIKLDRTFFVDYSELERAVTVVAGIITMAKNLGIKTVAEGVETKEQIEFLKELGCDIVQGYYYAKPMPVADLNCLRTQEKSRRK